MLEKQPLGGSGYDWTVVLLSFWFLGGLFVDGWAHNHIRELESFFTPWHAVFYSGFLAVSGFLIAVLVRNHAKGAAWRRAMPVGYELSILGVLIFMAGGIGDMVWHQLFGIEANVEALLSPTHLTLALGATLILAGPFRAGWHRPTDPHDAPQGWVALLPQLLSLTFMLSLWSFLTQFAHPLVDTWAAAGYRPPATPGITSLRQSMGIVSFLLQTGLLMGLVLLTLIRWALPIGSLALVFALNASLMSFMHDQYRFIPAAALAGFAADLLVQWLKPTIKGSGALRLFAFTVPVLYYVCYYVVLIVTQGIGWSVHLWTGSIVLSGVVGLMLSYLLVPPVQGSMPFSPPTRPAAVHSRERLRA
jgi:hypothetical protein